MLKEIEKVPSAEKIIQKTKENPEGIVEVARLAAYYLKHNLEVELDPPLFVGGRLKQPDLRVKYNKNWIYIESATPSISNHRKEMQAIMSSISNVMYEVQQPLRIEVYLYRDPNKEEVDEIIRRCKALSENPHQPQELYLSGLAQIFTSPIGQERLSTFRPAIEEKRPILVLASAEVRQGGGRACTVKLPFTDERAEIVLKKESKQLSREESGMIILDISSVPAGLKGWPELIKRRLQPNLNRRIGAVLLIQRRIAVNHKSVEVQKNLIIHPNPLHPLLEKFLQLTAAYA